MNYVRLSVLLSGLLAAPCVGLAQVRYTPPVRKTAPSPPPTDTVPPPDFWSAPDLSPLGENPALDPNAPVDDRVYTYVEQMPVFPGGPGALLAFLAKNYRYPAATTAAPPATRLHLRFVVDKIGAVRDPEVLQGYSPAHDAEALRVVRLLPRFQPGRQNGRPMNVYYTVPLLLDVK